MGKHRPELTVIFNRYMSKNNIGGVLAKFGKERTASEKTVERRNRSDMMRTQSKGMYKNKT